MYTQDLKSAKVLSQKEALRLFNYAPETGIVTRKIRTSHCTKIGDVVGSINGNGYLYVQINGKKYRLHRVIWLISTGEFPPDRLDHINGHKTDNRLVNLRAVTSVENSRNSKRSIRNKSGTTGVMWNKQRCKWRAVIWVDGKSIYLGYFEDIDKAIAARKIAEASHKFHSNHGRVMTHTK